MDSCLATGPASVADLVWAGWLGGQVEALVSQAAMARNRLDACREKSMSITHRFLVVLQRLQVRMHASWGR